jgi:pyruvyltransferase
VEALSYVSFVLSHPFETEFMASIGTLQEQFYTGLALPFEKFRSPGFTVENSEILSKALVMERLSDNSYGEAASDPVICPKTDITKEWDIMVDFTMQLYSEPVPVVQSCADDRYDFVNGCNRSTNNTLYFYDWQGSNFGDELSPRIIQSVTSLKTFKTIDRDVSALKGNVISGLGSILHDVMRLVESADTVHIWGSGAHEYLCHIQPAKDLPKVHVHAVRGPLTAACLDKVLAKANMTIEGSSYIYGDPGLLAPFIYPSCQKARIPTCQVCILPHKSDEALAKSDLEFQRLELLGCAKTTAESPETIVAWIVGCSKVVSSSLHGIIVAEAFDIPSVWMQLSGSQKSENSFKYLDYYLATGRHNATPVTELQSAIKSPSIDPIADDYNVWDLVDSFPYESWGGCRPLPIPLFKKSRRH